MYSLTQIESISNSDLALILIPIHTKYQVTVYIHAIPSDVLGCSIYPKLCHIIITCMDGMLTDINTGMNIMHFEQSLL